MRRSRTDRLVHKFARSHNRRSIWRSIVTAMAAVVVFCTTYALILPAITLEDHKYCGLAEHTHSDTCYTRSLTCTQGSGHTHSDSCYQAGQPTCGHGDGAVIFHTHTEGCYDENSQLICTLEAETVHTHTADCYGERKLVCGQEESTHQHSGECYSSVLTCDITEHTHSLACHSDRSADMETPEIWESTLPTQHTNNSRQDLLAVAKFQLGYRESVKNYTVVTDTGAEEMKGYTRYGHWYGQAHGDDKLAYAYQDWDALFVSFCLHYAGIPEDKLPHAATAGEWAALLENSGMFQPAADYTGEDMEGPWEGDLAFFDTDGDNTADRVGIVSQRVFDADGYTMAGFLVIRGDTYSEKLGADAVSESFCALNDQTLLGFAVLPSQPDEEPMPLATENASVTRDPATGKLTYKPPKYSYYLRLLQYGIAGNNNADKFRKDNNVFLIHTAYDSDYRLKEMPGNSGPYALVNKHYIDTAKTIRVYLNVKSVSKVQDGSSGTRGIEFTNFTEDSAANAKIWYFETIPGDDNTYYIYTVTSGGGMQYLQMTKNTVGFAHLDLTSDKTKASYFILKQNGTGSIEFTMEVQFQDPVQYFDAVDTVSPSNTKINVFDYWVGDQTTDDNIEANDNKDGGINQGKNLKFRKRGGILGTNPAEYNVLSTGAYQGIVKNTLTNGYPVLKDGDQSLAYLFDPASTDQVSQKYRQTIQNAQGLLRQDADEYFVYDCTKSYAYLQKDGSGKYTNQFAVYREIVGEDSVGFVKGDAGQTQFFPFNPLYWKDNNGVHGSLMEDKSTKGQMNHYFGLTLTARFIQQNGGNTSATSNTPTRFEFSGDDDVWIFIDDVLVADLGGIHGVVHVTIDFSTGDVTVDPVSKLPDGTSPTAQPVTTTLRQAFQAAQEEGPAEKWSTTDTDTFADGTVHTLKFFYLERGNSESNMTLKYNLIDQNASSIHKVDQDGNPITGAEFKVYKADQDYKYNESDFICSGTTDSDGIMYFTNPSTGAVYDSISQLFDASQPYIVLKETKVPDGYRTVSVSKEAWLRLDPASGCMICDNVYKSGVWARNNALVSITNQTPLKVATAYETTASGMADTGVISATGGYSVKYVSNSSGTTPSTSGTLFAVVLKKNGGSVDTWTPIYGSNTKGYTSVPISGETNVEEAIAAAKAQAALTGNGGVVFALSAAEPQLLMENLPGEITSYQEAGATTPEYTVEFFWTPGSLANATSANTLRVEEPGTAENPTITHTWGTTVEVPNMENRLFFQKMDPLDPNTPQDPDTEKLLNGATFALYHAIDAPTKENPNKYLVYYKGYKEADKNTIVYVALLSANGNTGSAEVFSNPHEGAPSQSLGSGTYSIDQTTGVITVTVGSITYYVDPAKNAEDTPLVGDTHSECDFVAKEGTGHFNKLIKGEYCLREIKAPEGYELNPTDIPVVVNDNGVFAYAGGADEKDDVSVGNGVGYVTKTLNVFAVPNGLDETLAWVQGKLFRNTATGFAAFDKVSGNKTDVTEDDKWKEVSGKNNFLVYDGSLADNKEKLINIFDYASNTGRKTDPNDTEDYPLLLLTDSGWSDLEIYQDNNHNSASSSNYVPLTGDISNLFSSSTFVRVTDTPKVTMTKLVQEGEDWVDKNDASIGDEVKFQITVSLEKPGATKLELTDSLDEEQALTYLLDSNLNDWKGTIVRTGTTGTEETTSFTVVEVTSGTEYSLTETKSDGTTTEIGTMTVDADQRGFTIGGFNVDFLKTITKITFYYTARLNYAEDQEPAGFKNTATLTYSGGQKEYTTTDQKTVTSTWKLPIFKYTGSGTVETPLANAEFTLALKHADNSETPVKLESPVAGKTTWYTVNTNGTGTNTVKSDANGLIEIRGLDSGTYTLTESKAPDGYLLLTDPIQITIGNDGTITPGVALSGVTVETQNGVQRVKVLNYTGHELPSTGGMGTALFTICGLLMMAAAVGCGYGLRRGRERRAR